MCERWTETHQKDGIFSLVGQWNTVYSGKVQRFRSNNKTWLVTIQVREKEINRVVLNLLSFY